MSVSQLADQFYADVLSNYPERAHSSGIELDRHDGLNDNSSTARKLAEKRQDEMLAQLKSVDVSTIKGTTDWITHAFLVQELRGSVAARVCRTDLWDVSHMDGWHSRYAQLSSVQPVGTD